MERNLTSKGFVNFRKMKSLAYTKYWKCPKFGSDLLSVPDQLLFKMLMDEFLINHQTSRRKPVTLRSKTSLILSNSAFLEQQPLKKLVWMPRFWRSSNQMPLIYYRRLPGKRDKLFKPNGFLLFLHLGHAKDGDRLGSIRVETEHVPSPRSQASLMATIPLNYKNAGFFTAHCWKTALSFHSDLVFRSNPCVWAAKALMLLPPSLQTEENLFKKRMQLGKGFLPNPPVRGRMWHSGSLVDLWILNTQKHVDSRLFSSIAQPTWGKMLLWPPSFEGNHCSLYWFS